MNKYVVLFGALLSACATLGSPPPSPATATRAGGATESDTVGRSKAKPYFACGARTSYLLVASVFRCPDGSNPFRGNLRAAAESRRGNVGPHLPMTANVDFSNSHIVDQYSVPCSTGPVEIFVCMYHCEDGQSPIGR
jgi:hypothetical protein